MFRHYDFYRDVANKLQQSGHYTYDEENGKFLIKRIPIRIWHELKIAAMTAAFSLLVGFLLWLLAHREEARQYEELKQQLNKVSAKVDSLTNP